MAESMRMLADIQALRNRLPGLDCGACGAPTCRAFAEDVVKGVSKETECLLSLKQEINEYLNSKQ
jgi:Na+-translocating ferredoxin:NAD+ oxidoreductase RNF subunit RnfB